MRKKPEKLDLVARSRFMYENGEGLYSRSACKIAVEDTHRLLSNAEFIAAVNHFQDQPELLRIEMEYAFARAVQSLYRVIR